MCSTVANLRPVSCIAARTPPFHPRRKADPLAREKNLICIPFVPSAGKLKRKLRAERGGRRTWEGVGGTFSSGLFTGVEGIRNGVSARGQLNKHREKNVCLIQR